ncbi:MAG: hypothetical protein VCC04_01370 [Myxococcota bacterium]
MRAAHLDLWGWFSLWGLAVALGFGCAASGVPLNELSDQPIALVYWEEPAARKRAEQQALAQQDEVQRSSRMGVAELSAVAKLVGSTSGSGGFELRVHSRIVLLNPRTLEIVPFKGAPRNSRPLAWSQDRKRLLYSSRYGNDGRLQLYEFDIEMGEVRRLTYGSSSHLEGDYSPDGRVLCSWMDMQSGQESAGLDIRPAGGGRGTSIVEDGMASGPRWSPRGDVITYFRADDRLQRRDESVIVVQEPTVQSAARVVARGRDPVFTPDGEWIVYSSQGSRGWRLRRVRPDGSARSILGDSHLDARWPTVSPDGRHVAYVSNADGLDRLYLRRIDGSGDRILLEQGSVAFPIW